MIMGCLLSFNVRAYRIAELEFKHTRLKDIIRVLSEETNTNIIATPEAAEKNISIFLRRVTLEEAIKAMCRISNLWYRKDKEGRGIYRIMTKEQYSKDLVIGQYDDVRVFTLRNPNVTAIATAIQDLYGSRVVVSYGSGIDSGAAGGGSGRAGSRRGGGRSNRGRNKQGGRSGRIGGRQGRRQIAADAKKLTVEQLEVLTAGEVNNKEVDEKKLNSVLGQNSLTYITINEEHNLLVVKSSDADMLKSIARLVEELDKPQIQVMLEMKIVDIQVGEDFDSIFNFELTNTGVTGDSTRPIILGGAALTGGGSLVYEFIDKHIKANIELLEKNNRLNVIANPMIVASNHRPASLFVGEERIMVRGYSIDTIDNLNTTRTITTPETELKEIGTRLEITPHINNDGSIHILIQQENATLNKKSASIPVTDGSGTVLELPVDTVSTARLEGEIFARHGYTVAVGGLIRDSFSRDRRKVPYLADAPVIGNIFRSTQDEDSRSEMVLLITPYILTHDEKQQGVDPTRKYHRHGEELAFKAKAIPELQQKAPEPVCGQYCAPVNMRRSDL